jgi:hypothetical protein
LLIVPLILKRLRIGYVWQLTCIYSGDKTVSGLVAETMASGIFIMEMTAANWTCQQGETLEHNRHLVKLEAQRGNGE